MTRRLGRMSEQVIVDEPFTAWLTSMRKDGSISFYAARFVEAEWMGKRHLAEVPYLINNSNPEEDVQRAVDAAMQEIRMKHGIGYIQEIEEDGIYRPYSDNYREPDWRPGTEVPADWDGDS